jgi:hypothetical protein
MRRTAFDTSSPCWLKRQTPHDHRCGLAGRCTRDVLANDAVVSSAPVGRTSGGHVHVVDLPSDTSGDQPHIAKVRVVISPCRCRSPSPGRLPIGFVTLTYSTDVRWGFAIFNRTPKKSDRPYSEHPNLLPNPRRGIPRLKVASRSCSRGLGRFSGRSSMPTRQESHREPQRALPALGNSGYVDRARCRAVHARSARLLQPVPQH